MNLDTIYCGDLESDNLAEDVTKIHVLSIAWKSEGEWKIKSTSNYEDMRKLFSDPTKVIAIHNGVRFDGRVLEKILEIEIKATIIDTLAIAWYIDCKRGKEGKKYGLAYYGEDTFNTPKPKVDDWENLSYEEYKFRCEEDTKITYQLWEYLLEKLRAVYTNDEDIVRVIKYLNFIMLCSRKQEEQKVQVDLVKLASNMAYFEGLKEEKFTQLQAAMPKLPIIKTVVKPKVLYKKDGKLSVAGMKWYTLLEENGIREDFEGEFKVTVGFEDANPNSVKQKKEWLYSLGWVPQTFSHNRDKETNETKKVEQILTEEKLLCPSVLKLVKKEPAIELLNNMSILTHRIGIFKGMQKNVDSNGFVVQGLMQLANSLRWQHSVIVNYPKVTGYGDIRDGKWVRECLIAGEGNKLIQSDLSGIESRTSDHYTFNINYERILKTKAKYFDPHTEISVTSNLMTADEEIWFKWKKESKENPSVVPEDFGTPSDIFYLLKELKGDEEKKLMDKLKEARSKGKTTNYSSLYLVGSNTLARTLGISKKEAQSLIDAYWKLHYAVKKFSEAIETKTVDGQLWLLNPMSKFWHSLRYEKDVFSLCNQSSAVYCFNMWIYQVTRLGVFPITQTHDDLSLRCKEGEVEKYKGILNKAMENLNKQLKLNVEIACEIEVGDNFAETH